jgi:glycosyltransferase involved in cell wall biosynthesis
VSLVYVEDNATRDDLVMPIRATPRPASAFSIGRHRLWSRNFAAQIANGLTTPGASVIHDNGVWGYTNFTAARVAARGRIPLVISPHGMLEPWALQDKATKKRIALALYQRSALESASLLMVTAQNEYESVRRVGLTQPVAIVPAGVFVPATIAHHAVESPMRRMLFLSRIHRKKGLLAFVEAWRQVRHPGWKIVIAGPDQDGHKAEVRALIAQHGLQADFEFPGEVEGDAKQSLYESADLFVLPTFSENFGVVVAEAMSYGLPVLTTRGTPWNILETITAGWWVEPGVAGIAGGLRAALATTPTLRATMGHAGRAYVIENLGWSTAASKTYAAYAWLLGLHPDKPEHVQIN